MYYFYDEDPKTGKWKKHKFSQKEAKYMFWIFFILGFVIPIIMMILCANN